MISPETQQEIIRQETHAEHFQGVSERGRSAARTAVGHAVRRMAELAGQQHTVEGILRYLGLTLSDNDSWREGATAVDYPITDEQRQHYGFEHPDDLIRGVDTAVSMLMPDYSALNKGKDLAAAVIDAVRAQPSISPSEIRQKLSADPYPSPDGKADLATVVALDGVVTMAHYLAAEQYSAH